MPELTKILAPIGSLSWWIDVDLCWVGAASVQFWEKTFAPLSLLVFSHDLKREMKSPQLVDLSWDLVDLQINLSRILAAF